MFALQCTKCIYSCLMIEQQCRGNGLWPLDGRGCRVSATKKQTNRPCYRNKEEWRIELEDDLTKCDSSAYRCGVVQSLRTSTYSIFIYLYIYFYIYMFADYLLQNGWTDLAKLFLLAPSWSRDGFRPKKFRIRDPVFPDKTGSPRKSGDKALV